MIILYGVECWPYKNSHVQKMNVEEIKMLRWKHTRREKIRKKIYGVKWG